MYALVDCNNFYCSCERLFNPKLKGRPIIVLSNNDGCAISRSDEAKKIGIAMGTPAYLLKEIIAKYNVAVFSSNYTLYGDMSDRVMKTMAEFVPRMEIYSIDEAFLDLHDLPYTDLLTLGVQIRKTVIQNTGIPVTIGIAPTKTLAKMANRYAKKKFKALGAFYAGTASLTLDMLSSTPVGDIWGVGHQYSLMLTRNGFKTAADLINAPEDFIRDKMSVVGLRLLNEIKGIPAIQWEFDIPAKKNICTSRSFGNLTDDKVLIGEALSNYAANCAEKLRKQRSACREINVFINTNPHKIEQPQYARSITIELERATNNTAELIKYGLKGLDIIFKEGYKFLKCGFIVQDLVPEDAVQESLFDNLNREKGKVVMDTMDKVNKALGKETIRMATQGFLKKYRLKAEHLSPCYTTNINHIIKVRL